MSNRQIEWENTPTTVTLTNRQLSAIGWYLRAHARALTRELDQRKEWASELLPDGTPRYGGSEDSQKFFSDQIAEIEGILEALSRNFP